MFAGLNQCFNAETKSRISNIYVAQGFLIVGAEPALSIVDFNFVSNVIQPGDNVDAEFPVPADLCFPQKA